MKFSRNLALPGAMGLLLAMPGHGAVIGTNTPAPEVTTARLLELPAGERPAWADYIARSQRQHQFDRATLAAELRPGDTAPPAPAAGSGKMPLTRDAAWYATAEARAIADTIVSFQTPSGGWSKNQDRTKPPRQRGQRYSNDAETMQLNTGSFDAPQDRYWTFVGTLDNGATTTEMRFLGRVQAQLPGQDGDAYRASIVKGVQYLLMAQYPNGGWPQNYPLEGGFHDGITFNDNAVAEAAGILEDIAEGHADFAFVPGALRQTAGAASARALPAIAEAVKGKMTIFADGGARTGTDIFRLLALGADGVLLGRAFVYALAAQGQAGVDKLLAILEISFTASDGGSKVLAIDAGYVNSRLDKLSENEDLSRYVL